MTTFADIQTDIADSVDDSTGEYRSQIKRAILKAIRSCERETFYFTETRDVTFSTVEGQQWYGADANANIPTLVHIEKAYITEPSGQVSELVQVRPVDLEYLGDASASKGEPYWYVYFGQQLRLYPVPDARVYTVRLQLGPYRLTPLSADTDTNAWLTEAYDMIYERAKYHLAADTFKDAALAQASLLLYQEQKEFLDIETSKRIGSGFVRATDF